MGVHNGARTRTVRPMRDPRPSPLNAPRKASVLMGRFGAARGFLVVHSLRHVGRAARTRGEPARRCVGICLLRPPPLGSTTYLVEAWSLGGVLCV